MEESQSQNSEKPVPPAGRSSIKESFVKESSIKNPLFERSSSNDEPRISPRNRKAPSQEDWRRAMRLKGKEVDPPDDSDTTVLTLWRMYPSNRHQQDRIDIPQKDENAIVGALARDGAERVTQGLQAFCAQVDKWTPTQRAYLTSIDKFFNNSDYRKDPAEWERKEENAAPKRSRIVYRDLSEEVEKRKKLMQEINGAQRMSEAPKPEDGGIRSSRVPKAVPNETVTVSTV